MGDETAAAAAAAAVAVANFRAAACLPSSTPLDALVQVYQFSKDLGLQDVDVQSCGCLGG